MDGYTNFDITLTTDIGSFIIEEMYYCNMLDPGQLLPSYRPGFGDVIKSMLIHKIY